MTPDWRGGSAPHEPEQMSHSNSAAVTGNQYTQQHAQTNGNTQSSLSSLAALAETSSKSNQPQPQNGFAAQALAASTSPPRVDATASSYAKDNNASQDQQQQESQRSAATIPDSGDSSSQSLPISSLNSQETVMTDATDPTGISPVRDGTITPNGFKHLQDLGSRDAADTHVISHQNSQLLQLSAVAAAQDRIMGDVNGGARKRNIDGEVKVKSGSMSPEKGHSRNVSAVSMASTTGSTIGELSAELKTRLSYAMVKVNHGWQSRSINEVETLASQAASPASSTSTVHRRHGSSASPNLPMSTTFAAQGPSIRDNGSRRTSDSPPILSSNKPALAPPAAIQPSMSRPARGPHPRRNSNPRYAPTMLSQTHSQRRSPHTPGGQIRVDTNQPRPRSTADPIMYSPHQNVREQDAIETLLFMSSPGNSANLKHAFSPAGSPGPHSQASSSSAGRHALPGAPRRTLPTQRPAFPNKRTALDNAPIMPPPASPMDVDSPQQFYNSPMRGTPRRRVNGASDHMRGALSLPSGLGVGNGIARKVLRDEDIERMLDRAEGSDSSDDEEIQLPRGRNDVAGVMGV